MNIALLLSMLVQAGVCAPVDFQGKDGGSLTVLVCPVSRPAAPSPEHGTPAPAPAPGAERAL